MIMQFLKKYKFIIICVAVVALSVIIDLITKSVAENNLQSVVPIIGNWLVLVFTTNGGSSFSFLDGTDRKSVV